MKIPEIVNFKGLKERKLFTNTSSEYKKLDAFNDAGEWKEYCNEMLSKNISVIYDATGDYFLVKPVGFNETMYKNKKIMSVRKINESNDVSSMVNKYTVAFNHARKTGDTKKASSVQTGLKSYFERIGKDWRKNPNAVDIIEESKYPKKKRMIKEASEEVTEFIDDVIDGAGWAGDEYVVNFSNLEGKDLYDCLLRLAKKGLLYDESKYDDGDDPEEPKASAKVGVDFVKANYSNLLKESRRKLKEDAEKFLLFDEEDIDKDTEVVDEEAEQDTSDMVDLEQDTEDFSIEDVEDNETEVDTEVNSSQVTSSDIERIVDEMLNRRLGDTINSKVESQIQTNDALATDASIVETDTDGVVSAIDSEFGELRSRVDAVTSKIDTQESYLDELNGDTSSEGQSIEEIPETQVYESEVPDEFNPTVTNEEYDFKGEPITITIKGWIIDNSEIETLAESVRKCGGKLKKLKSNNTSELYLFVESNKSVYKIKYEDRPFNATVTPWSISDKRFTSLKEAITKAKYLKPTTNKERFFNKLVLENKDLRNRQLTNLYESDIFEDFRNPKNTKEYVPSWNVKSVGMLELKTGLNETYSNITKHTPEVKNTLVLNKEGKYYLLKGNLHESNGIKRHIVDMQGNRDYGVSKVVGIYENTTKGLRQIAERIGKTTINLLVWR